jgi:hypothetical protein
MFKKAFFVPAAILFTVLFVSGAYAESGQDKTGEDKAVTVEIDYGGIKPCRITKVPPVKGKTVLEVLEAVAEVETRPVAGYVFVTAVDGVKGKRGETAWYYQADGKPSPELAYTMPAEGIKRIRWSYQKDLCSGKVDNHAE